MPTFKQPPPHALIAGLLCWVLLPLLSACQATPPTVEPPSRPSPLPVPSATTQIGKTRVFDCGGEHISLRFGPGEMALFRGPSMTVLSQTPAASGARYVEGDLEFWVKGDRATAQLDGRQRPCERRPAMEPKVGYGKYPITFRALGNEPPWLLEVDIQGQLLMATGYDMEIVTAPNVVFRPPLAGQYLISLIEGGTLNIMVEPSACVDSMRGDAYDFQITIQYADNRYSGCGRMY